MLIHEKVKKAKLDVRHHEATLSGTKEGLKKINAVLAESNFQSHLKHKRKKFAKVKDWV